MYLSHLLINVGDNPDRPRPGRLWLRNLYHVHQRLCMAFPSNKRKEHDPEFLAPYNPEDFPEQHYVADKKKTEVDPDTLAQVHRPRCSDAGFLFRIDPETSGRVVILVQSAVKPDWDYAFKNAGYLLAAPPEVKSFNPDFTKGQLLRFRFVANPTRKIDTKSGPDGERRNGKRVPIRDEQLLDWLTFRAEQAGFSIDYDSTTVQPGYIYVNKTQNGKGQSLRAIRFEGVLKVKDPASLKEALVSGIGPGKAFGFGLISIAPLPTSWLEEAT
jgi:CRISPR system Cascade subunit CasE